MTAWFKVGTVSVTENSDVVTFADANVKESIEPGFGIYLPDGELYEIVSVDGPQQITIAPDYAGTSQTAQPYRVVPTKGPIEAYRKSLESIVSLVGSIVDLDNRDAFAFQQLTREAFVADASNLFVSEGTVVFADGLAYKAQSGATAISDLPGWVPSGPVQPGHFKSNPAPGVTDMGGAIQAAFDYAFTEQSCRAVHLEGEYASSIAISPVAAQGENPGNFDMPFALVCNDARITFTGEGNSNDVAFSVYCNTNQRSVRYGTIKGRLTVLNDGDWRDGIEFQGCNWWTIAGVIQAGELEVSPTGPRKGFTRNGIRYTSNNGKGGLWNKWGQAIAFGGEVPIYVGPVANANQWDHVFSAFGEDGLIYNGGDRNTFSHMSAEFNDPGNLRYMFQNAGIATIVTHGEFEKVSATSLSGTDYLAAIWCTGGSLLANVEFYALATGDIYLVAPGALMDLTWLNDVSSTPRIERICIPPTWMPQVALRRAPLRKSVTLSTVGVNGTYPARQNVIFEDDAYSLLPMGVVIQNNTNQTITVNVATRSEGGTVTDAASVNISAGSSGSIDGANLATACVDGSFIDAIQARARTSAASYTGSVTVIASAMPL